MAFNDYVVDGEPRRRQPGQDGHQGGRALHHDCLAPGETRSLHLRLARCRSGPQIPRLDDPSTAFPPDLDDFDALFARPQARGRRVLRRPALRTDLGDDERKVDAPGAGRHAVDQAVLSLHRARLARRRPGPAAAAARAQARPQPRVAAPLQRRRHVDAGQVGVSLVRRLGPGVPLHPAGAGRPRVRQGAARSAAARVVPAPERADAGLRVGLRRREPAGATPGRPGASTRSSKKQHRPRRPGSSWSASSTSCCSTSPGGSTARTRRATTSSRAASWGWTTSASSTAAPPLPTGGHLEQSDGTSWMAMFSLNMMPIALELARDEPRSTRTSPPSSSSISSYIAEAMNNIGGRGHRAVGRRGRVLLRRAAPARRQHTPHEDPLDGRPDPAVRGRDDRAGPARAAARLQQRGWSGSSTTGPTWRAWCRAGTSRAPASAGCWRWCAATA